MGDLGCALFLGSEAVGLLEDVSLGPEPLDGDKYGLTFVNCGAAAAGLPAVSCDRTRAISLLQAELLQRVAPIEVRFEEQKNSLRGAGEDVLRNGGNLGCTRSPSLCAWLANVCVFPKEQAKQINKIVQGLNQSHTAQFSWNWNFVIQFRARRL